MIHQLARLVEISVTLNSTLDLPELLEFIIQTAADLVDSEAASILLHDERLGELRFAAATGSDPDDLAKIPVPLDGSVAGMVFQENHPLIINDAAEDPRLYTQVGDKIRFQTRSLIAVPLRIRDKVIGVLEAVNKRNGRFTQNDTRLLSVIASQAAVAIHNAHLVERLRAAYDEISRLDQMKTDFMAIASHELRTPLGVILGYAAFLKEEAKGEVSKHANRVLNAALKLRSLVEDMTNMNLLRVGTAQLSSERVAVQELIRDAVKEIKDAVRAKGHRLIVRLPPTPVFVQVDREKMVLTFSNILSNAVRFTPGGGQITVTAQPGTREVRVIFQDTGIGIPQEELESIFKEFYQVEHHLTRRYGGLGLGLSIAKAIVELHNGRIWAESPGVEQGSTFYVVLQRVR